MSGEKKQESSSRVAKALEAIASAKHEKCCGGKHTQVAQPGVCCGHKRVFNACLLVCHPKDHAKLCRRCVPGFRCVSCGSVNREGLHYDHGHWFLGYD